MKQSNYPRLIFKSVLIAVMAYCTSLTLALWIQGLSPKVLTEAAKGEITLQEVQGDETE
jgi:hypothetical protein